MEDEVEAKGAKEAFKEGEYFIGRISEMMNAVHINTPVRYDTYGVGIITTGEGSTRVNGRPYTVDSTSVFYFGPNAVIEIFYLSGDFDGTMIVWTTGLTARTGFPFTDRFWDLFAEDSYASIAATNEQKESILFLVGRLNELSPKRTLRFYTEMARNYFIVLLYELSDIYRSNYGPDKNFTRKEHLAAAFLSRVHRYCRENRELRFYADQLKVTPKYLSKIIKELTNQTAGSMIDKAVMLEAKLLLSNPDLSLGQVAETLHFGDQSVFGKFFKKNEGLAPSDYRLAV